MNRHLRTCALLAAAGTGERLAAQKHARETSLPPPTLSPKPTPKAFLPLAGKPLFLHSLEILRRCPEVSNIVIVVPRLFLEEARRLLAAAASQKEELVIPGAETRQQSVYQGLLQVPPQTDYVLIHDAARPFLSPALVQACLEAARECGAATCALPAAETIKSSTDGKWVEATLERRRLWTIQTPQAFSYKLILEAHEHAARQGLEAPDDAALVEKMGHPVRLVAGSPENIKITHPSDLALSEQIASRESATPVGIRIGLGFDAHAFGEREKLVLAGVEFPGPGLAGHSDADLICHAAADALLGAAGLGDIGTHFPDTDPEYAGVFSLSLLEKVGEMLASANLRLAWLDVILAAEQPKIAAHTPRMRENLARALGVDPARISLKGKTTEGLGFIGRKEGLACWAVCLLISTS